MFQNIIKVKIIIKNQQNNEWIIGIDYLKYLLNVIYKMKHPKFAHIINSMKSDKSVLSINGTYIYTFMESEWNVIYESTQSIDYDKIVKYKSIPFINDSKITGKYYH